MVALCVCLFVYGVVGVEMYVYVVCVSRFCRWNRRLVYITLTRTHIHPPPYAGQDGRGGGGGEAA